MMSGFSSSTPLGTFAEFVMDGVDLPKRRWYNRLGSDYMELSTLEIERGGRTYTADTLKLLKDDYDKIYFIIGADSLFTLNTWYKPDYICANCHILAANRDEHPLDELIKRRDWLIDKYNAHIDLISCDDYPFSSTFIRDEAAAGHNISPFVGNAVAGYIADNGLYNKKFFTA